MIVGMKSDKNQPLSGQKLLAQFHTKRWWVKSSTGNANRIFQRL